MSNEKQLPEGVLGEGLGYRDIACRLLDKLEREGWRPDEVIAMTARIVALDDARVERETTPRICGIHGTPMYDCVKCYPEVPPVVQHPIDANLARELFEIVKSGERLTSKGIAKFEKRVYGEGRPVKPHASGPASFTGDAPKVETTQPCFMCLGHGSTVSGYPWRPNVQTCPHCKGTGKLPVGYKPSDFKPDVTSEERKL